ncbi:MAG: response regulator, partial [Methanomicrobia archaeon]|nr:response regulator [Methanomicrobia archaeon]
MRGEKVVTLLVEDEEAHAMLTMRTLEEEGPKNDIRWVADGEEALEYLFQTGSYADKTKSPRPDLVL